VSTLLIGTDVPVVRLLADALEAEFVGIPDIGAGGGAWPAAALDAWRDEVGGGPAADRIAVAAWPAVQQQTPLVEADAHEFAARCELPFAAWFAALGAAVQRAADVVRWSRSWSALPRSTAQVGPRSPASPMRSRPSFVHWPVPKAPAICASTP
jgi:hypothetical protein